uniref:Putative carnitine o-acyltransferase crat n=1 Tax=Ixodes ricinus TaxID=34613 RepID=A0A0K8RI57_IXORI
MMMLKYVIVAVVNQGSHNWAIHGRVIGQERAVALFTYNELERLYSHQRLAAFSPSPSRPRTSAGDTPPRTALKCSVGGRGRALDGIPDCFHTRCVLGVPDKALFVRFSPDVSVLRCQDSQYRYRLWATCPQP